MADIGHICMANIGHIGVGGYWKTCMADLDTYGYG